MSDFAVDADEMNSLKTSIETMWDPHVPIPENPGASGWGFQSLTGAATHLIQDLKDRLEDSYFFASDTAYHISCFAKGTKDTDGDLATTITDGELTAFD